MTSCGMRGKVTMNEPAIACFTVFIWRVSKTTEVSVDIS
jgi:hypothetical protein